MTKRFIVLPPDDSPAGSSDWRIRDDEGLYYKPDPLLGTIVAAISKHAPDAEKGIHVLCEFMNGNSQ